MTEQRLGRYEIVRELGKGAMGVVYEAVDPAIGRRVALKTILAQQGISAEEQAMRRERFQREARAAGVLSHPNIVTVYDVGEDRYTDTTFFAMEFIQGDDLSKILHARGALPSEEVISIVAQVADALDFAHKSGIVHRDIKPANIVLMPDGRVKVTDFGIAKLDSSTLTQTGAYLGTPTFMAPEMISGRAVDGRADQFSLGVVTYQLLTNQKPFTGENLATLSYQIVNRDPAPLRSHREDLPEEVEQVFLKVLAKSVEDRYPSCVEFVRDLRQVILPHDESTLGYDEVTRATGPGSAKVRTLTGPGTGRTRAATGPGSGKTRAALATGKQRTVTSEVSRVADVDGATRLESSQATIVSAGGGLLVGAIVGILFFLMLAAGGLGYWLLIRKQTPPVVVSTVAPPTATTLPSATPSPMTPSPVTTAPSLPTPSAEEIARKKLNDDRWARALAAYGKGQYDTAINELTMLLQDDPSYPNALALLGTARKSKADEAAAKARETAPTMTPMTPAPTAVASKGSAEPSPKAGKSTEPETMTDMGGETTTSKGSHATHGEAGGGEESGGPVESAGEGSTLAVNFDHHLSSSGAIRVWVDGKKVLDSSFEAAGDPVVKIKAIHFAIGKSATFRRDIPVAPGSHEVKVEVQAKGVDTSNTISASFKAGKSKQLNVGVGNVDKKIELEWD